MSRSINKIILVGNVGRDPDIQVTQAGTKVAHLSLATSRRIPKNGGIEERTDWHRLTVWDRLAELVEDYVRKGGPSVAAGPSGLHYRKRCQMYPENQTTRSRAAAP